MNIERITEKARIYTYYQGLNYRLREIAADIARIDAQDELFGQKTADEITEYDANEALFRSIYRSRLEKEAAEIRLITETPAIKHAEP